MRLSKKKILNWIHANQKNYDIDMDRNWNWSEEVIKE